MDFKEHFYDHGKEILLESGVDLKLKCTVPRNLGQKYFPILKAAKFRIEMLDPEATEAVVKLVALNDLINLSKEVNKNLVLSKDGGTITIQEK